MLQLLIDRSWRRYGRGDDSGLEGGHTHISICRRCGGRPVGANRHRIEADGQVIGSSNQVAVLSFQHDVPHRRAGFASGTEAQPGFPTRSLAISIQKIVAGTVKPTKVEIDTRAVRMDIQVFGSVGGGEDGHLVPNNSARRNIEGGCRQRVDPRCHRHRGARRGRRDLVGEVERDRHGIIPLASRRIVHRVDEEEVVDAADRDGRPGVQEEAPCVCDRAGVALLRTQEPIKARRPSGKDRTKLVIVDPVARRAIDLDGIPRIVDPT